MCCPIPFLQRLKKNATDEQYQKFVEMLVKLQVNIPFSKVVANIPACAKFLKEIVSNKKKLKDFAEVSLTKKCSVVLQNHLPIKMKDPGSLLYLVNLNIFLLINICVTLDLVLI